jgi:hypothetical protein
MKLTKRLIVSNHSNNNLEFLLDLNDYGFTSDNIYIYERSPSNIPNVKHLGKVIESPNVGSNIYDIGKYIVENYDDLADINIFLKGNITWRTYTNRERFLYALTSNWFVPIDNDPVGTGNQNFYEPWGEKFYVNDSSLIVQILKNDDDKFSTLYDEVIRRPLKCYNRFKNKKEFLEDLFEIGRIPDYLSFCPGANFTVPKHNILKYSKNFYKKMMYYTDYFKDPIESHYYERVFNLIWQGCLKENKSFQVPEDYNG